MESFAADGVRVVVGGVVRVTVYGCSLIAVCVGYRAVMLLQVAAAVRVPGRRQVSFRNLRFWGGEVAGKVPAK